MQLCLYVVDYWGLDSTTCGFHVDEGDLILWRKALKKIQIIFFLFQLQKISSALKDYGIVPKTEKSSLKLPLNFIYTNQRFPDV